MSNADSFSEWSPDIASERPAGVEEPIRELVDADMRRVHERLRQVDFRAARDSHEIVELVQEVGVIPCETAEGVPHALTPKGVEVLVEAALEDDDPATRVTAFEHLPDEGHLREAVVELPEAEDLREDLGISPVAHLAKRTIRPARRALATWANSRIA